MSYYEALGQTATQTLSKAIADQFESPDQPTKSGVAATTSRSSTVQVKAAAAMAAVARATPERRRTPMVEVRAFQQVYGAGLSVDGVYGFNTRAAIALVTGNRNLPPVASGVSSAPSPGDLIPSLLPPLPESLPQESGAVSSWLVPVAVVSTVVAVAGFLFLRKKKPVRPNRKSRLRVLR